MAAAVAKVLRGGRSGSFSENQHLIPAIYRRKTQEGVALLLGSSPGSPAAGMRVGAIPMQGQGFMLGQFNNVRGISSKDNGLSELSKLKANYVQTKGIFQECGTRFSILHISESFESTKLQMTAYRHHWRIPASLALGMALVAIDLFVFSEDSDKKKYQDLTASVNQFTCDAVALEQSFQRIEMALAIKAAIKEGVECAKGK